MVRIAGRGVLVRRIVCGIGALAFSWSLTACGGSSGHDSLRVTDSVELKVAYFSDVRAKILVDGDGYALYVFAPDDRRAVTCSGTCALTWPPLTVPPGTRPATGQGVQPDLIGTDVGPGGTPVVTYDSWPLYTYSGDVQPGTASGQAIDLNGGAWYVIRPDGSPITAGAPDTGDGAP